MVMIQGESRYISGDDGGGCRNRLSYDHVEKKTRRGRRMNCICFRSWVSFDRYIIVLKKTRTSLLEPSWKMDRVRRRSLRYIDASFRQQLEIDKLERKFIALSERIRAEKTRSRECQQNINRIVFRDPDLSIQCAWGCDLDLDNRSQRGRYKKKTPRCDVVWFAPLASQASQGAHPGDHIVSCCLHLAM